MHAVSVCVVLPESKSWYTAPALSALCHAYPLTWVKSALAGRVQLQEFFWRAVNSVYSFLIPLKFTLGNQ